MSRELLQSAQGLPCLRTPAGHRMDVACQRFLLQTASSARYAQRVERLVVLMFLDVRESEKEVRIRETRVHLEEAAELIDRLVVLAGQVQNDAGLNLGSR